jgi:hypothetical protein
MLPSQWSSLRKLALQTSATGMGLICLFLLIWLLDGEKRKQRLVIIFGISSLMNSFTFVYTNTHDPDDMFCRSNSVPLSPDDGFTFCYFQALVLTYSALVNNLAWLALAIDLFLRISVGIDKKRDFNHIYLPCVFILPLISVIYAVSAESYGYTTITAWCFNMNVKTPGRETDQDLGYVFIPMTIFTCVGCALMLAVIVSSVRIIWKNSFAQLLVDLKVLKTPIAFVVFGAFVWFALISYRIHYYIRGPDVRGSYMTWIHCVFVNFDGSDDSFIDDCGILPPGVFRYNPLRLQLICLCGQSIFLSGIYLSSFLVSLIYNIFAGGFLCLGCFVKGFMKTVTVVQRRSTASNIRKSLIVVPVGPADNSSGNKTNEGEHKSNDIENGTSNSSNNRKSHLSPAAAGVEGMPMSAYESEVVADEKLSDGISPLNKALQNCRTTESTNFGKSYFNMESADLCSGMDDEAEDMNAIDADAAADRYALIQSIVGSTLVDVGSLPAMRNNGQRYEAVKTTPEADYSVAVGNMFARSKSRIPAQEEVGGDSDYFMPHDDQ